MSCGRPLRGGCRAGRQRLLRTGTSLRWRGARAWRRVWSKVRATRKVGYLVMREAPRVLRDLGGLSRA